MQMSPSAWARRIDSEEEEEAGRRQQGWGEDETTYALATCLACGLGLLGIVLLVWGIDLGFAALHEHAYNATKAVLVFN